MLRTLRSKPKHVATALGSVGLLVVLALAVIGPPMAVGQATRTWVSGVGDDANPCSRTAPCKTFAGAISKTAAGGEINCLDPAGFGAVTITKSLTIDCTGTLGGVLASGTTGIIVNIAGGIVTLRGLEINGGTPLAPGTNGIRILQAASVHIYDVTIYNFRAAGAGNGNGIIMNHTSTTIELDVTDTWIHDNGVNPNGAGIRIQPSSTGAANVSLTRVNMSNNTHGLFVSPGTGAVNVAINESRAFGNVNGYAAVSNAGQGPVNLMIDSSTASGNSDTGVAAIGPGALVRIGRSSVFGNVNGTVPSGGAAIESYQTNQIRGNGNNGTRTNINQE